MRYKADKREFLFLVVYSFYLISLIMELTMMSENSLCASILQFIRYCCYLISVLKILKDGYFQKHICPVILLSVLVLIVVLTSSDRTFLFYFIILLAAKDVNMYKIIKVTFVIQATVLAIVVLLSRLGIIQDYIFDPNGRGRHGLGFTWTTTGAILLFFVMMSYIYMRKEKLQIWELVIMEVVNGWFFIMTDARMSFYLSSLLLAYIFIMQFYWQNRKEKIRKNRILILAPAVMCCIGVGIHVFYDSQNAAWVSLNNILSGRLELGHTGIDKYGISLFGTFIEWVGFGYHASSRTYNYVDCSYLQILLNYGIIFLIAVILAYTYIMYMAVKIKDFYLQTVILFIVIFSITEPRLFNLAFNPFPFLAFGFLAIKKQEDLYRSVENTFSVIHIRVPRIGVKNRR